MAAIALLLPASALSSAPITVTNTSDSGPGSLREAILDANSEDPGASIVFEIPASDAGFNGHWFTISPLTALPPLVGGGTTVDGGTQSALTGDTNPSGPEIFIDGRSQTFFGPPDATPNGPGLWIDSSSNVVEGLTVSGFPGTGITIASGDGNVLRGLYVGTDPTGTVAIPNGFSDGTDGIAVFSGATDSVIGGTTVGDRNLVSGNERFGVIILGSGVVEGNYVGTDVSGETALGNQSDGIRVGGSAGVTIGGTAPGAGNVISGNGPGAVGPTPGSGVGAGSGDNPTSNLLVEGNLIGTDASGSYAVPNAKNGVVLYNDVTNSVIGGTTSAARNVISGNLGAGGVAIGHDDAGIAVLGNYIGTSIAGLTGPAIPNAGVGIADAFDGSGSGSEIEGNTIANNDGGGIAGSNGGNLITANVISSNAGVGVLFDGGTGNTISRNSIFSNGGLGIALDDEGAVIPNDPGDTDTGPNNLQNFPVLSSAIGSSGQLVVTGTLDTPNPQTATVELFGNSVPTPGADPTGYGQGQTFLGVAAPAPNGTFTVALPPVAPGTMISATATDAAGNTSEFAKDVVTLPASADQCKNGGWQAYGVFKNQGDCVSYVATGGKNLPG